MLTRDFLTLLQYDLPMNSKGPERLRYDGRRRTGILYPVPACPCSGQRIKLDKG